MPKWPRSIAGLHRYPFHGLFIKVITILLCSSIKPVVMFCTMERIDWKMVSIYEYFHDIWYDKIQEQRLKCIEFYLVPWKYIPCFPLKKNNFLFNFTVKKKNVYEYTYMYLYAVAIVQRAVAHLLFIDELRGLNSIHNLSQQIW
jgi:hypothetical protein